MTKLVVEVLNASDLIPKDNEGSANPYVQVFFDEQQQRTQTKLKNLNPSWNEKLVFNLNNPSNLPNKIIEIYLYHEDQHGEGSICRNLFLGRVKIYGITNYGTNYIKRYQLEKRGLLSLARGDIALKIYVVEDQNYYFSPLPPPPPPSVWNFFFETESEIEPAIDESVNYYPPLPPPPPRPTPSVLNFFESERQIEPVIYEGVKYYPPPPPPLVWNIETEATFDPHEIDINELEEEEALLGGEKKTYNDQTVRIKMFFKDLKIHLKRAFICC